MLTSVGARTGCEGTAGGDGEQLSKALSPGREHWSLEVLASLLRHQNTLHVFSQLLQQNILIFRNVMVSHWMGTSLRWGKFRVHFCAHSCLFDTN